MVLPFFRPRKKQIIAIDVGAKTIKAFLFEKENGKIILLGKSIQVLDPFRVWESHLVAKEGKSLDFDLQVVQEFIKKAVRELEKKIEKKAAVILLTLPSLMLRSELGIVQFDRINPNSYILKKEEKEIFKKTKRYGERAMSNRFSSESLFFVSFQIIGITIDGYSVPALKGFNGKKIELKYLISAIPKKFITRTGFPLVLSSLSKGFVRRKLIGTFHEARHFVKPRFSISNGTFLDIGGKETRIFILKDGRLSFVSEFELGGEEFTADLAQFLGKDLLSAEELKIKYAKRELSQEIEARIKERFDKLALKWFAALKEKLKTAKMPISSSFYLFGGGSLLPEIKNILETGNWEELLVAGPPLVKFFLPSEFAEFEDPDHFAKDVQDTPILLLCLAGLNV